MPISYSRKEIPIFRVTDDDRRLSSSSSKGNQPKWCINNKVWIKGDYLGYEGLSEVVASNILHHSNISDFVEYNLCGVEDIDLEGNVTNYFGCYSYDLKGPMSIITLNRYLRFEVGIDTNSKSFNKMEPKQRIQMVVSSVEDKIPDFGKWLTALFEFDAFILNEDRHLNNIILLVDSSTGEYRSAPFFDCGASFCSDTTHDYKLYQPTSVVIRKVKSKPFSTCFSKQVEYMRELYGPQLKLTLPENFCVSTTLYESNIVERVNSILRTQRIVWKDMFV